MFCKKKEENSVLKAVLITAGVVITIVAALAVLYKVFKKHFKITFECEDCDFCDNDTICSDDDSEPECICHGCSDDIFDELDAEDEVNDAE